MLGSDDGMRMPGPGEVICNDEECMVVADAYSSYNPGDVVCDGDECALLLDTVGDGEVNMAIPLKKSLPLQGFAQKMCNSPIFELCSIAATLALIYTFAESYGVELTTSSRDILDDVDTFCSTFFLFEFLVRWWAVGLEGRYWKRCVQLL